MENPRGEVMTAEGDLRLGLCALEVALEPEGATFPRLSAPLLSENHESAHQRENGYLSTSEGPEGRAGSESSLSPGPSTESGRGQSE